MECFVTMITPYTKNGDIDYDTAEKYVDWYFDAGLDGIFAVCQSSEMIYLSLEERVELNRVVYKRAKALEQKHGRRFTVVSSGHISDELDAQINELNRIYESGTDALIMVTNRFDRYMRGDSVFLENLKSVMSELPSAAKLGLYECPLPYKRLTSDRILEFCTESGRFAYMKDTCCDTKEIGRRCDILKGSDFKLLNANCQTLLESVRLGADGYCGIMCNFHPKLYTLLKNSVEAGDGRAEAIQSVIGNLGFTETLAYPLTAKYHFGLCGIETELISRNRRPDELRDYDKSCMEQMKYETDLVERFFSDSGK